MELHLARDYSKFVIVKVPTTTPTCTFPKEWFEANKSKPLLHVPDHSIDLPHLTEAVLGYLRSSGRSAADPKVIVAFLIAAIDTHWPKLNAPEHWDSYGQNIVAKDAPVTPLNLLKQNRAGAIQLQATGGGSENWQEAFIRLILAYRMLKVREAPSANYHAETLTRLGRLASSCMWRITGLGNLDSTTIEAHMGDVEIRKIMAAIDMYLYKYPTHELSFLRAGTIVSRFRECVSLGDVAYLAEMTGLTASSAMRWIFDPTVTGEIFKMYTTEDEVDVEHSYLPYLADLNLCSRSPYSSAIRPAFHNWVHLLGSLFGNPRSLRAALIGTPAHKLVLSAVLAAYALRASVGFEQQVTEKDEKLGADISDLLGGQQSKVSTDSKFPIDKSPSGWASWYTMDESKEVLADWFSRAQAHLKPDRKTSVEAFLSQVTL
jgi:hypothetical protein